MRKSTRYALTLCCCVVLVVLSLFSLVGCNGEVKSVDSDKVVYLGENNQFKALEKQKDKDFKIMLFTDLQLWMNLSDNDKVYDMMDKLVEEEPPDLIILPGDNVSGIATKSLLKKLIKKMESYKIPWAPVYGNHDMEGVASISWQSDRFEEAEYCLFERGQKSYMEWVIMH